MLIALSYHAYCSPYHMSGARQDIFTSCNDISNDATDDDTDNDTDDDTAQLSDKQIKETQPIISQSL